jgi:phosphoribosylanthranilate isomerase
VKTSLIPLFSHPDVIYRVADFYQPDIIHFCESLIGDGVGLAQAVGNLINLQEGFRRRFPEIKIMRSIPVGEDGKADQVPSLEAVRLFEAVSDYFLLDTFLAGKTSTDQPEVGFVGITGKICDWSMAAKLVEISGIPVVLAGGLSPENVSDAVFRVRPAGVDSCTNTNAIDPKGNPIRFKKDPDKVKRLIETVRKANLVMSNA